MTSNSDDLEENAPWQPVWRRQLPDVDPALVARVPELPSALQSVFKLRSIQDLCKLVGFSFRLPANRGHELLDPAAAIERLERYRTDPTPQSAAEARKAILQFVRALPADQAAVLDWENRFGQRDMTEFRG